MSLSWKQKKFRFNDRHSWEQFSSIRQIDDGTGSITTPWPSMGCTVNAIADPPVTRAVVLGAMRCQICGIVVMDRDSPVLNDDCPILIAESIHEA